MTSRCLTIVIFALALRGTSHAAEQSIPAHQDLLLLSPLEPLRVRLVIEVNSVPFRKTWHDTVARQFTLFDTDRKGALTAEQAEKFLAAFRRQGIAVPLPTNASGSAMMAAQRLSQAELQRQLELAAPPISLSQKLASQGAGPALIPLLDADGDGRLSRDELSQAEQSLHCRDFNDDQLITQQELIAGPSSETGADENSVAQGAVLLLTDAQDAAAIAEILLGRYDRNRDGLLSLKAPAELISADGSPALAVLDADQDQMLSRPELLGFLALPFDAELPMSFGELGSTKQRGRAKSRFRLRPKGDDGGYRLYVGSSGQVDFGRTNRDPSNSNANRVPRFRDFDADSNESLDANELMNVPDRPDFALLDADRDGKISVSEFDGYFLQQSRIAAARFVLEVSDEGSDLFTAVDANGDGVLTPRELKATPALLATEDLDGDGFLGGVEMKYRLKLELSRGGPRPVQNNLAGERRAAERTVKERREGPAWFQKMDRNRDGDVSLSEFLGSRATFQQLDKDGNQLLSANELP